MIELRQFNKVVNPNDLKCYIVKDRGKGNISTIETEHLSFDEILAMSNSDASLQFGIDLSVVDMFFIDCDSRRSNRYLDKLLKGYNYIKISSVQKHHYHYYFKYDNRIIPGMIQGTDSAIHDWYKPSDPNPFCPVIPLNNNRKIEMLPATIDYLPEYIGIRDIDDNNIIVIDEDNGVEMCTVESAFPYGVDPKLFLYNGIKV